MAEGTSPDYHCFVWGENINGVPIWFNVTHSGITGYYASYFDDSSYHSNEELTAKYGIPLCGAAPPPLPPPPPPPQQPPAPQPPAPPQPTSGSPPLIEPEPPSVFYSPNENPTGVPGLQKIATEDVISKTWATGDACSDRKIVGATPNGTSILAGWSNGRLGPIYFLAAAGNQRRAQVHAIILFDPGSTGDFEKPSKLKEIIDRRLGIDPTTCDWRYRINSLLAHWLSLTRTNHLVIFTGADSEEQTGGRGAYGRSTYAGLWKFYLAGIWNKPFARQAQICDYHDMGHKDVLREFAWVVKNPPPGCPPTSSDHQLTAWNP